MTAISWANDVSGDWTTAADWSTGTVPTLADDVSITDGIISNYYIVSITSADVANTLTFNSTGIYFGGAELLENAGSLTLSGALTVDNGLVILNLANNIGGGVSLAGGVLSVGNAGALGTGQLTGSGGELLGTVNETLTNYIYVNGQFSIAAAHGTTLDIGSVGWGLAYDNLIPNFGGPGLDGTVVLHVPSISTSGGAGGPGESEIQSGTLKAGDGHAGDLLQAPIVDAGATLDLAGFNVTLYGLQGSGTVTDSGAAATLTINTNNLDGPTSFAGAITGALSLSVGGGVTLTGANTYTGTTTINGGSGLGSASLTIGTGGSIGGGAIDDEGGLIIDSSAAVTLANFITGPGYLTQEGSGTTSINAANSYGDGTFVSAGTLAVGNAAALGTGTLTMTGGELLGTATETLTNGLDLQGSYTIAAAHGTTLDIGSGGLNLTQATGDTIVFGAPGQDGTVVCDFAGSVDISESLGVTEVQSGTLQPGNGFLSLADFGRQFIVDAGATLDLAGNSQSYHFPIYNLTGAGTVTDSGAAANLSIRGATFAGTFSGALSLDIQTTSLFSGLSHYSGDTYIENLATLTNTGDFDLVSNAGVLTYQSDPTATFVNDGLFEKTGGGGVSTVEAAFTNNDTITVTSGSVSFTGGFTNNGVIHGLVSQSGGVTTISAVAAPSDFNGDGTSDILLQNGQQLAVWLMNGTAIQPGSGTIGTLNAGWAVAGTGDFNNDGHADILLQNGQQLAVWLMNGTAIQPGSGTIGTLNAGWTVAGTGDFNNDGHADILLQNGQQLAVWLMNGTAIQPGSGTIGTLNAGWTVAGTGDFNNDGHADILLQNGQQLAVWLMNGTAIQPGSGTIGTLNAGWTVAGTGVNNDGHADILLQNGQQLAVWLMNGTAIQPGSGTIGTLNAGWTVAGTGDFNNDGHADNLLQNGQQLAGWLMNGTAIQPGSGNIGILGAGLGDGWHLA